MNKPEPLTPGERVARRRARGVKPKPIRILDVRSSGFREQARRDAKAVGSSPSEADDQAFIDSVSIWDDLPPYDGPLPD
jgi:hypothetical protein